MSQDRIAQRGVGQRCDHGNLDGGEDFSRTDTEGREPEDAIVLCLHEAFTNPRVSESERARRLVSIGTLNKRYATP